MIQSPYRRKMKPAFLPVEMMETTDSFGYWVRRRRKALDLTQEELAQCVGCAAVTLRKIESDERRPSAQMAERLAHCLGLPEAERPWFIATALGKRAPAQLLLPSDPTAGSPPGNLPSPVTAMIGRTAEVAAIADCLRRKEARLLTLTGPVGVGKTRLAIEVGHQLLANYRNGVYLVELSSVRDPLLVPAATASVLGVREAHNRDLAQSIADFLGAKHLLLIFDNFEHLLPAASFLSTLLSACPALKILVTSRASLRLYGEHEIAVAPLPLPDANDLSGAADSPCVRLFYERARAARADFHLTPSQTPAVVEICRRLDGLPLAVELAAARIKLFSPRELQQRLDNRLSLLTQGAMNLPPRLQGLENAIAWSYGLLSPAQRTLLDRLAVFAGGFALPEAEAICASPLVESQPPSEYGTTLAFREVAEGIDALLGHSLLVRQTASGDNQPASNRCCPRCPTRLLRERVESEPRFSMLETIREFALDRLRASGELATIQQRHAEYFTAWVVRAASHLQGPEQDVWLVHLEREADNLRAALNWLLITRQAETAAHIACALGTSWQRRAHYSEGRGWLDKVLAQNAETSVDDVLHGRPLQTAARLAYRQGDWQTANAYLQESLALFHSAGDQVGKAHILHDLGCIALDQADWPAAIRLNEDSLRLARDASEPIATYRALTNLGRAHLSLGDRDAAAALFHDAYKIAQRVDHTEGIAFSLTNLSWIALYAGDSAYAKTLAQDGLRLCHLLGEREIFTECLEILASTALVEGEERRAAQLSGAAEAIREELHITRPPTQPMIVTQARTVAALRAQLPETAFEVAWRQGRGMCLDAIANFALSCAETSSP